MNTKKMLRDLNKEIKQFEYLTIAQVTNYFYRNYLDAEKFNNSEQYDFLLKSDRFNNGKHLKSHTKFLVENRQDFIADDLKEYYNDN